MGCTGSKQQVVENNPLEFKPKDLADSRPDQIRKDINELYKVYLVKRDKVRPLLAEKYGINSIIDEEREKLMVKLAQKEELMKQRKVFMDKTWERDADDIHKAFTKFQTDKSILVNILCARTYWQIQEIGVFFQKKYGVPLIAKVVNELTTLLGSLLTGGGTGLSRLLTYRILPQPERDGALLKDCTDGMSLDSTGLLEVICTRTNVELKSAIISYTDSFKKDIYEVVKNKSSYKNYREFVLKVLECNHDENYSKLDMITAKQYATELYNAGAGRALGFDPEPFIRLLANINPVQFESINEYYPNKQLLKDIQNKLGGDFQLAVVTRCTNRYEYFAQRLETALRGFSPDKETLCRILGCLSRPDCVKVKLAYNRLGFKRTLDEAIRTVLKGQVNYMNACLMLISEDTSITPLGSDKELTEEELEIAGEADRLTAAELASYPKEQIAEKGGGIMLAKRKLKRKLNFFKEGGAPGSQDADKPLDGNDGALVTRNSEDAAGDADGGDADNKRDSAAVLDPVTAEEDRILNFYWDGKGRFLDAAKLATIYRELEYVENQASLLLDRLGDENNALLGIYSTILKHDFATEAYIRIYQQQIRHITEFIRNRDLMNPSMKK